MMSAFLARLRCPTCGGNVMCSTEHAPGVLAEIRTWTCIMCSRDAARAELISFKGERLATYLPDPTPTLQSYVWDTRVSEG